MLQIYRRFWEVNWAEQWQYRANLLMYLLYWLVSPVVYLAVWTTVARSQGSVGGLGVNDFTTYYLTLLVVDLLTSDITIHILSYKIQDGTLASQLLLPVHPILTGVLVNNLAFKALTLLVLIPVWTVLSLLFRPDFAGVTLGTLATALPMVVVGFGISFFLGASLTCLAFWTTRIYSLAELYWGAVSLLSGQFVPLELLPAGIQQAAVWLPFHLLRYTPIQMVLGRLRPEQISLSYLQGAIWLAASAIVFRWIWKAGLKRFSAVGA